MIKIYKIINNQIEKYFLLYDLENEIFIDINYFCDIIFNNVFRYRISYSDTIFDIGYNEF